MPEVILFIVSATEISYTRNIGGEMRIAYTHEISRSHIENLLRVLEAMPGLMSIFIDSPGGKFEFFRELAAKIESRNVTTVAGDVRSAAVILFLLGRNRIVTPSSKLFFHEPFLIVDREGFPKTMSFEQLCEGMVDEDEERSSLCERWLLRLLSARAWFVRFACSRTNIDPNTLSGFMKDEVTLGAEDAIKYGFANIFLPRWPPIFLPSLSG